MQPGGLIVAFKTVNGWKGVLGMDARCKKIELSVATSVDISRQLMTDKLPADGRLKPFALKMINTVNWMHTVYKHLNKEFSRVWILRPMT